MKIDAILDSDLNTEIIPDDIERDLYENILDKLSYICRGINALTKWICCRNNDIVTDAKINKED